MMPHVRLLLTSLLLLMPTCGAQSSSSGISSAPAAPAYPSQGTLAVRIAAIVQAPAVSRAHWGVAVTAMDGTPLYGFNEGQFFRPASNAKLFTTAAAMALLGPDKTFTTQILGKLDAKTGTVEGDLVLVGGGDPSFGSNDLPYVTPALRPKTPLPAPPALADLREMVNQLVAKGVKRVKGRIVGDDTLFPYEPYPATWDSGDAVWGYGAPVSALTIADNQMLLTVTPPLVWSGQPTAVKVDLDQNGVDYYKLDGAVLNPPTGDSHVEVERAVGSRTLRVFGDMTAGTSADVEHVAIGDPALYAAMVLRYLLMQKGIRADGEATVQHSHIQDPMGPSEDTQSDRYAAAEAAEKAHLSGLPTAMLCSSGPSLGDVLATHTSLPLSKEIRFTNKVSQNLHAEILLRQLGSPGFPMNCELGSTVNGIRAVRSFLTRAGLTGDDTVFYDGSGLSSHDLVTPRATAKLLSYASTQPWFAQWKASLPTGGEDGTLRSRFSEKSGLKDHVFAKTGTLGESRALSGYLDTASGKTVVFSIFVDTHTPANSADREAMDAIVAAIAAEE